MFKKAALKPSFIASYYLTVVKGSSSGSPGVKYLEKIVSGKLLSEKNATVQDYSTATPLTASALL